MLKACWLATIGFAIHAWGVWDTSSKFGPDLLSLIEGREGLN